VTEGQVSDIASMVVIDRTSPVPLYFQLAQELQRLIHAEALPAGSRLSNEIALADRLGVSRPTMRRAIQYLVDRGLLVRKRGVGTQVVRSQAQVRRSLELTSLYDDLQRAGRSPSTRVLRHERVEAGSEPADALGVPVGSPVTHLERLRLADDEPIALMTNIIPGRFDIDPDRLEEGGLYEAIRAAGIHIRVADQTISATAATTREARLLDERKGSPLLAMRRVAYDDEGRAVEYGNHLYRASRYSFSLTLIER
jgi:DNA-binding GntR family transcriptional regulator